MQRTIEPRQGAAVTLAGARDARHCLSKRHVVRTIGMGGWEKQTYDWY
jgi:hypothetical protein